MIVTVTRQKKGRKESFTWATDDGRTSDPLVFGQWVDAVRDAVDELGGVEWRQDGDPDERCGAIRHPRLGWLDLAYEGT